VHNSSCVRSEERAQLIERGPLKLPRIAALLAERQALESEVASLRTKKASMTAAAYEAELERLLLALAEKTQAIRAAGGGK
jgi:hypothetical protein